MPIALYAQDAPFPPGHGAAVATSWSVQHEEWLRTTVQLRPVQRSAAQGFLEGSDPARPTTRKIARRSSAGQMGSGVLSNAVDVWMSSGIRVNESTAGSIDESVDVGAQANPSGIYPVLQHMGHHPHLQLPSPVNSFSAYDQQRHQPAMRDATNPSFVRPPGTGAQQPPWRLKHPQPQSNPRHRLATLGSTGLSKQSRHMSAAETTIQEDTTATAGLRGRKGKAGERPRRSMARSGLSLAAGVSTAALRAAAQVPAVASVLAASAPPTAAKPPAKIVAAETGAGAVSAGRTGTRKRESTNNTGDAKKRHHRPATTPPTVPGRSQKKPSQNMPCNFVCSIPSLGTRTVPVSAAAQALNLGQVEAPTLPEHHPLPPSSLNAEAAPAGPCAGVVGERQRETHDKAGLAVASPDSEDPDSWLTGMVWAATNVAREALPAAPLNALRSDDGGTRDDEESILFLHHQDTALFHGLEESGKTDAKAEKEIVEERGTASPEGGGGAASRQTFHRKGVGGIRNSERNTDKPRTQSTTGQGTDGNLCLQGLTVLGKTGRRQGDTCVETQGSTGSIRNSSSRTTAEMDVTASRPSLSPKMCLRASWGAHGTYSLADAAPLKAGLACTADTETKLSAGAGGGSVTSTFPCAPSTPAPSERGPSEAVISGDPPRPSSEASQTPATTSVPQNPGPPPSTAQFSFSTIYPQPQPLLKTALPAWAHHPPPLPEIEFAASPQRARGTSSSRKHAAEIASKQTKEEHTDVTPTAHNRHALAATPDQDIPPRPPVVLQSRIACSLPTTSSQVGTCMESGCCAPADYELVEAGAGAGAGAERIRGRGSDVATTRWCAAHRREGSKLSRRTFCSFPGCRLRWSWGYEPAVDTRNNPTRCCTQHKHDG